MLLKSLSIIVLFSLASCTSGLELGKLQLLVLESERAIISWKLAQPTNASLGGRLWPSPGELFQIEVSTLTGNDRARPTLIDTPSDAGSATINQLESCTKYRVKVMSKVDRSFSSDELIFATSYPAETTIELDVQPSIMTDNVIMAKPVVVTGIMPKCAALMKFQFIAKCETPDAHEIRTQLRTAKIYHIFGAELETCDNYQFHALAYWQDNLLAPLRLINTERIPFQKLTQPTKITDWRFDLEEKNNDKGDISGLEAKVTLRIADGSPATQFSAIRLTFHEGGKFLKCEEKTNSFVANNPDPISIEISNSVVKCPHVIAMIRLKTPSENWTERKSQSMSLSGLNSLNLAWVIQTGNADGNIRPVMYIYRMDAENQCSRIFYTYKQDAQASISLHSSSNLVMSEAELPGAKTAKKGSITQLNVDMVQIKKLAFEGSTLHIGWEPKTNSPGANNIFWRFSEFYVRITWQYNSNNNEPYQRVDQVKVDSNNMHLTYWSLAIDQADLVRAQDMYLDNPPQAPQVEYQVSLLAFALDENNKMVSSKLTEPKTIKYVEAINFVDAKFVEDQAKKIQIEIIDSVQRPDTSKYKVSISEVTVDEKTRKVKEEDKIPTGTKEKAYPETDLFKFKDDRGYLVEVKVNSAAADTNKNLRDSFISMVYPGNVEILKDFMIGKKENNEHKLTWRASPNENVKLYRISVKNLQTGLANVYESNEAFKVLKLGDDLISCTEYSIKVYPVLNIDLRQILGPPTNPLNFQVPSEKRSTPSVLFVMLSRTEGLVSIKEFSMNNCPMQVEVDFYTRKADGSEEKLLSGSEYAIKRNLRSLPDQNQFKQTFSLDKVDGLQLAADVTFYTFFYGKFVKVEKTRTEYVGLEDKKTDLYKITAKIVKQRNVIRAPQAIDASLNDMFCRLIATCLSKTERKILVPPGGECKILEAKETEEEFQGTITQEILNLDQSSALTNDILSSEIRDGFKKLNKNELSTFHSYKLDPDSVVAQYDSKTKSSADHAEATSWAMLMTALAMFTRWLVCKMN